MRELLAPTWGQIISERISVLLRHHSNIVLFGCAWFVAAGGPSLPPAVAGNHAAGARVKTRVAHVLVALADNRYQGIVPVPAAIGNGDDPARNLYWGAGYGVRTFFERSEGWQRVGPCMPAKGAVLERCVFLYRFEKARDEKVYMIADAYRGREIKQAVADFFAFSAGRGPNEVALGNSVVAAGGSDLVAYVGHDGLMDFKLDRYEYAVDDKRRDAVMLACASKSYFADTLRWTGAKPLVWTTGLMAPEAYVLEAVLTGWANKESDQQIRRRAALAYDKYQHCGENAAMRLFVIGW